MKSKFMALESLENSGNFFLLFCGHPELANPVIWELNIKTVRLCMHWCYMCVCFVCVDSRMECWNWAVAAEDVLNRTSYWSLPCINQWSVLPGCTQWKAACSLSMEQRFLTDCIAMNRHIFRRIVTHLLCHAVIATILLVLHGNGH